MVFVCLGQTIVQRRTFLAFGVTGILIAGARTASAASETTVPPPVPPIETIVPPPASPVEAAEQYPISREDYKKVKPQFRPLVVDYPTREPPGTIVVDTRRRLLYFVLGEGRARRYGVGVGRWGFGWSGTATIGDKQKWPTWHPPAEMMERDREAAKWPDGMPGGPGNPLGARALYLYQGKVDTLYRIHGTREPTTIGRAVSSGCIRMLNADVADLFERAPIGTKVIVIGPSRSPAVAQLQTDLSRAFRSAFRLRPADRRKPKPLFNWRKILTKPN
ncbi:MAG: L,D-transpeptidase [Pseudomonadota bacterium]|nr:L,D-transpeptidase [Pseudomonadota bacterium]